ncbi:probable disease resistance protein At1g58602 [Dioscorea cayenensis subsp. rotundata]|uniref:Probable disease resistance protein At1g58602 n=1 Tax=Dioscorea cayennensis subsp. rotundata TaxID=55577 RepID=A0AB40BS21_DIOCR|nr:probable disease resistance protein At1g58602 [Dioscorea cayenensis subsp. rotundata]
MEHIVSFAVTKLVDLLAHEVGFLEGVDDELRSLRDLLQWIEALLKDTDIHSNKDNDERAKLWVNQVRDLAHDAEDIIDNYIFRVHHLDHASPSSWLSSLGACPVLPSKLSILHDLGNKIHKVKGRAQEIYDNQRKIGNIASSGDGPSNSNINEARPPPVRRRRTQDVEEADVLGFDEHFQALARMLMGDDGNKRRAVISITGMGGAGKTTLARKIFSDPGIKRHFTFQAWIWVSQENPARQLLEAIAKNAMSISNLELEDKYLSHAEMKPYENITTKDEQEDWLEHLRHLMVKNEVCSHLKKNKYLVILDDIWSKEAWDTIEGLLPDMMNGSRVLLTTRKQDVALHADRQSPPYEVKFLGEEDSWELFCKKAIPTKCSNDCPPHLKPIGREMVAKCCGLPLAIIVLGRLVLTRRQSAEEWRKLLKSTNWQLRQGEQKISEILALSYHHLPYYMKPCFLYFSIYPKGALISAKRLIRLWIAEGFIQPRDQETMEEVAEDYLEELVHWSMIQVVERHDHGGIKICRIHELLHDLSIFLAQGMNFIHIPSNDKEENILHNCRRLALHDDKSTRYIARSYSIDSNSRLRTITSVDMGKSISKMEKFFHDLKLLRVINLQGTRIKSLPNDIGKLIHLRYLGLRYTDLTELPSSIGKLINLQTLDIKKSMHISELPSQVWKMQRNLRHLEGNYLSIKGLPSTESLPNLQTLSNVKAGTWLQNGLQKMTNISKLGVHDVTGTDKEALLDCLGKLDNLTKLTWKTKLAWKTTYHHMIPSSIFSTSQYRNNIQILYLGGPLEGLPDAICMSASLTKLTLQSTRLQEDPLVMLGKLANLQVLRLRDAFVGEEMVCVEKGFPQLKVLELKSLSELEVWSIKDEAMPKLRELEIEACEYLMMLPQGLQMVTSLQKLKVIRMNDNFCRRLRNNDGEDWEKIKHIPSVMVFRERNKAVPCRQRPQKRKVSHHQICR